MQALDWRSIDAATWAPLLLGAQLVITGLWLGAILCVRSLTAQARWMADSEEIGRLASRLAWRCAWPWLVAGALLAAARTALLRATALHDVTVLASVGLATAMLVLHVSVAMRARRIARGASREALHDGFGLSEAS